MPQLLSNRTARVMLFAVALASAIGGSRAKAQIWAGYAADAQHTCISGVASQLPQRVLWSVPVDTNPPFNGGGNLLIHYASPLITKKNSVVVTTRTAAGFQLNAFRGQDGTQIWKAPATTDYILPPHNWIPVCGSTLVKGGQTIAIPGAGGTVYLRTNPDRPTAASTQIAFYGLPFYKAAKAAYDSSVFVCTPITADSHGNLFFGFTVTAATSRLTTGGLARISNTGVGSWVTAAAASGDANMKKVVYNCAPALSNDESMVYFGVNNSSTGNGSTGYLVGVNSTTLDAATAKKALLKDPGTGSNARLPDDGSGTPTVGPDGDVYFGVLDNAFASNNARGWLLHFSSDLGSLHAPSSFGWDDTASIVPAAAVPSYTGTSSYLLLTKFNDYANFGLATGQNKLAIVDPNDTQAYTSVHGDTLQVMKPIITVLGPTPNAELGGVDEWCINSAAIDPFNKCAVVNSEDGKMYRWDFTTNTLSPPVTLAAATGEAYTPTVIGPDGAVYAINRAVLNCIVKNP